MLTFLIRYLGLPSHSKSNKKMSSDKPKFLVLYPEPSNMTEVVRRINLQNSKIGPLTAVILLGNINCSNLESPPEVPTYYLNDKCNKLQKQEQIETFIGVKLHSVVKLHCGISMAFLGSLITSEIIPNLGSIDLLFSYYWPKSIASAEKLTLVGDKSLDPIVQALSPRYHFAAGSETGRYFEYAPFAWTEERMCRFISLGRENSSSKWFYAFRLGSQADHTSPCLPNPFTLLKKRQNQGRVPIEELRLELKKSRDDMNAAPHADAEKPQTKRPRVSPESCFFCLSNPRVETHMIVAIGKHAYLTIAKGPLTLPGKDLDLSGHAILVPIEHTPTSTLPEETEQELIKFQESLAAVFNEADYSVVFFEISRPENVHFHIQMVPIPKDRISQFEQALENREEVNNKKFANNMNLKFARFSPDDAEVSDLIQNAHIRFLIYEESLPLKCYVAHLSGRKSVDLQFPRRVLSYLLKIPKRQNWDRCRQNFAQETDECAKFKAFYEKYNFTEK